MYVSALPPFAVAVTWTEQPADVGEIENEDFPSEPVVCGVDVSTPQCSIVIWALGTGSLLTSITEITTLVALPTGIEDGVTVTSEGIFFEENEL